mmetsp:Transcript_15902/g.19115  ORF Transcript_15902/g.19115 Transcript_15902/m.19115 type:complete len:237 (-) Transcript_15902:853-1563(-)
MRVTHAGDVLTGGSIFHCEASFCNQLSCLAVDHMHSKHLVRLRVSQNLDETIGICVRLSTAVGHEREVSLLVFYSLLLELILSLANPGDFRVSVNHRRNQVVVHVNVSSVHALNTKNTLILGLVCKHGTIDDITDRIYTWYVRLELAVNLNLPFLPHFHTYSVEPKAVGERTTTNAHENNIRVESRSLAFLHTLHVNPKGSVSFLVNSCYLRVQLELESLLLQGSLEGLRNFSVNA